MFRSARLIEEETPPAEATVVDQTWRYLNRNGGPDRRFNDNRELPIGLYGKIDLRASQRIQCSRLKQPRDLSHPSLQCLLENAIPISASHGARCAPLIVRQTGNGLRPGDLLSRCFSRKSEANSETPKLGRFLRAADQPMRRFSALILAERPAISS